jgi:hypothetical protein
MVSRLTEIGAKAERGEALSAQDHAWIERNKSKFRLALGGFGLVAVVGVSLLAAAGAFNVPATPSSQTAASAAPPAPSPTLADEADALITDFKALATPCDTAGDSVKAAMQNPNTAPDELYSAAKAAQDVCHQTHLDLFNKLRPPPSADEATKKRFAEIIDLCQQAYYGKKHTNEALAAAVDSGMRPSKVAEFREYADATNAALAQCVGGMMAEVQKAGGKKSGFDETPTSTQAE